MVKQVPQIVFRQEPQRHWLIRAYPAKSFEFGDGQVSDYMSEIAVVTCPQ
jgi:hypothetical protein